MCRDCVISLNGREAFGSVVPHSNGIRFRVWTREWDTMGFEPGMVVAVRVPHEPETKLLIASVVMLPDTENSWVHFIAPVTSARSPFASTLKR